MKVKKHHIGRVLKIKQGSETIIGLLEVTPFTIDDNRFILRLDKEKYQNLNRYSYETILCKVFGLEETLIWKIKYNI